MRANAHHSLPVTDEASSEQKSKPSHVLTELPLREAPFVPAELVLQPGWLAGEESPAAVRITISRADGTCVASAVVAPAEESSLLHRLGLPAEATSKCAFVSDVMLEAESTPSLRAALMYLCARRARIWDRSVLTAGLGKDGSMEGAAALLDLQPLQNIKRFEAHRQTWLLCAQRTDIAIHRAWTAASEHHALLQQQFTAEAVETLERWMKRFFANSWFRAVREGTLTREQYIYTLSNLHQFVRWTTRHIGKAIACSDDRAIRNKWLDHLQGEVDHEIIIEKDLAALGADVDYVVRWMLPTVENHQFLVTQEAMVSFHADPVLIMASPFVAEGFTGHLDQSFLDDLRRTAKSWGIENPKQVTAFLASHVEFDGGDDGHWEQSRQMLDRFLRTEEQFALFMNVMRICQNAFDRSYSGYVDELAIFSASPRSAQ